MDAVTELADLPFAQALRPHTGSLAAEGDYDTVLFAESEFDEAEASGTRFLECAFSSVTFTGGRLRRARFNEVWMQGPRMVATDLAESEWLDSLLLSGKLAGTDAYGCRLQRVRFVGCKLDSVNLRGAGLTDVEFTDCTLSEVDFGGATLTRVRFPGSSLHAVRLGGSVLKKVDLRGAVELDVASGYGDLAGAIITTTQLIQIAPALAGELNISVQER